MNIFEYVELKTLEQIGSNVPFDDDATLRDMIIKDLDTVAKDVTIIDTPTFMSQTGPKVMSSFIIRKESDYKQLLKDVTGMYVYIYKTRIAVRSVCYNIDYDPFETDLRTIHPSELKYEKAIILRIAYE